MRPYRDLKMSSLIQEELGQMLLREFDFEEALVTITKVEVSPDLLQAKIGLSILPYESGPEVFSQIKERRRELQHKLLKKMKIRAVPHLVFYVDTEAVG